jgi:hypothetical protein
VGVEFVSVIFMDCNLEMLFWNVRGTNDPAKRSDIRDFLDSLHVRIVCILETKVAEVDEFYISQCLRPSFDGFVFLLADETRGDVVMAWDTSVVQINHVSYDTCAITDEVTARDESKWWLTTVYEPQVAEGKIMFLEELTERRSLCHGPWVVAGDFNMILNASEKNNENLDRNMMQRFRAFVHEYELNDLFMHGRTYTWSNEK